MQLKNVKAVITGGVSGLGLSVAQRVVGQGGRVAMLDVNDDKGQQAARELGSRASYIKADVTSEQGVVDALESARERCDGLNLLVNCAGILGAGKMLGRNGTMPLETFSKAVQINLIGTFNVSKAAAALMQENEPNDAGERGVIVNTASVAAYEGQIGQAAYSASKGGIVGMTLPMARELARFGIRVVSIAPGVFHTPMVDEMPEKVQQALSESIPFPQRLGKPEEFADLVGHICANSYINGTTIRLDGAVRLQPK